MWFASSWQKDFCGLYVSPCVFIQSQVCAEITQSWSSLGWTGP